MLAHVLVMLGLAVLLLLYVAACFGVSPRAAIHTKFYCTDLISGRCRCRLIGRAPVCLSQIEQVSAVFGVAGALRFLG